ncbi:MAG: ATP-dependent DNA helicase RecG, partial [Phycisphaerales bacterium]
RGDVTATRVSGPFGKQRFEAVLLDETGRLDLVWFNGAYLKKQIYPGLRLRVHGHVRRRGPGLQMANPKFSILKDGHDEPPPSEGRIRPVYPASEAIDSAGIERAVGLVLDAATPQIEDHLPEEYRRSRALPTLADAYRLAHRPESEEHGREARRRLAFDELLLFQLGVFMRRAQQRVGSSAPALRWTPQIDARIRARFPFPLTGAQDGVVMQIVADLTLSRPSNRLIQGDVGSGKTVVALYAMLMAVATGHQAALMAPTELLAEQHFASISRFLEGSEVRIGLLTGSVTGQERASLEAGIAAGDVDLVIGTHALLGERVRFESLAVVVVDEQHRFGVHQRATLRQKGSAEGEARPVSPHVLVMTATPIPRTLALTLFGDLDVSTIRELPPGRSPIATRVVSPQRSGDVYRWVASRLGGSGEDREQAYIVVPAIDSGASASGEGGDAELNDLRSVQSRLETGEFAGKRVAALHGRMSASTRDNVMARFRAGLIDALVCTTVIEVGVDVPSATMVVVEHAERFGLAQLHQLRGRVGRGRKRSACVLIAEPRTPDAEARLAAMAATTDGFVLAEKDMEIRGPGEVFGLRQAGSPPFRIADLMRDRELLALARRDAAAWIERSPALDRPEESLLRRRLMRLHGEWLGLADVG